MDNYANTLSRVEDYFDRTATKVWDQLTSDAPVSKVRATVRAGRDRMRLLMLDQLGDVRGKRILDAGCGTGAATEELARRGADVVAIDISPSLIDIARQRLPEEFHAQVTFHAGDMLTPRAQFDGVIAMDSLIYYTPADLKAALGILSENADKVVFTVAPRTKFLMVFWQLGKLFPRSDRSPVMIPQNIARLTADVAGCDHIETVKSGFYTSACMVVTS